MGRPNDAFTLMRNLGLGITNPNLEKIPIGYVPLTGPDTDVSDTFTDSYQLNNISGGTYTICLNATDGSDEYVETCFEIFIVLHCALIHREAVAPACCTCPGTTALPARATIAQQPG